MSTQGACTLQLSQACSWMGVWWEHRLSPEPPGPPEPRTVPEWASSYNKSQPKPDRKETSWPLGLPGGVEEKLNQVGDPRGGDIHTQSLS